MKVGINASFLRKPGTGIGQVSVNFLKKLIEKERASKGVSKTQYFLYLEEDFPNKLLGGRLPRNFKKRIFLPAWKRDDLIRKIWWEKFCLPGKIRRDGCDFFFSLYQSPTIICQNDNTKHLMLVHDLIPKLFPQYLSNWRKKLYWKLTEKGIGGADKIWTVSKRSEKDLIAHLKIAAEKIATNYIDVDEIFRQKVSKAESQRVLKKYGLKKGYIYTGGGLEVRKNAEGTMRAYKMLVDYNQNRSVKLKEVPSLVVSGKLLPQLAPLVTDVEVLAKSLKLKKEVKLLGFVPQEDLPALYHNASMFVYPSFYEGFGLPVLEALSQGIPTLTSKKSSLPEVGNDAVLYANPDDVEDIALTMRNILLNDSLRKALQERGLGRSQKFSWDSFVDRFLNIVREKEKSLKKGKKRSKRN